MYFMLESANNQYNLLAKRIKNLMTRASKATHEEALAGSSLE